MAFLIRLTKADDVPESNESGRKVINLRPSLDRMRLCIAKINAQGFSRRATPFLEGGSAIVAASRRNP